MLKNSLLITKFGLSFKSKVSSMDNKKRNIKELSEKVLRGVQEALRKLAEERAANNEELIIGDKDGNVKSVPAKDLLKTLPPQ